MLSPRGAVNFDMRTNQVFVTDIPSKLEEIAAVIAKIDIPVRQVLIEARIVEAVDSFGRALGVKLGYADLRGAPTSAGANVGGNYNAIGAQTGQTGSVDFIPNSQFVNLPANVSNLGGASTARFASPLNVADFVKITSIIQLDDATSARLAMDGETPTGKIGRAHV